MDDHYKTRSRRIGAALLDFSLFLLVEVAILSNIITREDPFQSLDWITVVGVLGVFLPLLYSVGMHYLYGQTVGKMFVNVTVVDAATEGRISFAQAVKRDSILIGLVLLDVILYLLVLFYPTLSEHSVVVECRGWVDFLPLLWTVAELLTMFSNSKGRSIHDFIASTVVIRKRETVE